MNYLIGEYHIRKYLFVNKNFVVELNFVLAKVRENCRTTQSRFSGVLLNLA